jgi:hypothetical protein
MKKTIKFFVLPLVLAASTLLAQRVDIDKSKFTVKRTMLPKQPQADNLYFYDVNVKSTPTIRQYIADEEIIQAIKIDGLAYAPNQPNSLLTNIVFDDFLIRKNEIISRTVENKDKDGKVTSKSYYYKVKLTYTLGVKYDLKNPEKADIIKSIYYLNPNSERYFETEEFKSSSEANKYYLDNSIQIKSNILKGLVDDMTSTISNYFSYQVGFKIQTVYDHVWILDSKKHEEYENYQKYTKQLIGELQNFTSTAKSDESEANLKPVIDYYLKISNLKKDDKQEKKLVYASLYNLATLYYYLDDPIQSKVYADKLINDDIDKKDGKDLVNNANELIDIFKINNKFSTHFTREIPSPDQTLFNTKATTSASSTAPPAKVPVARFVEGMVITNDDKEIEGYFFNEFENAPWEVQDGVRFIAASLYNDGKFDKKSIEKYRPNDLKGLMFSSKIYIPALFNDVSKVLTGNPLGATTKKYFLEVVMDGKYKVLSYCETPPSTMVFSGSTNPRINSDNLEKITVLLAPNEDKAKKITTSYIEEILMPQKTIFERYVKGEFSFDGKPINVKRDMVNRMTAKSNIDKNIDVMKIIKELNK